VGECLLNRTHRNNRLNKIGIPGLKFPAIKNHEVVFSYIGLLCQGKNDFDQIEQYRKDNFFKLAMNVKAVPSSPTMRQRLDNLAICLDKGVDFIIKHNLRRESQVEWLDKARQHSDNSYTPRPGKTVYAGAEDSTLVR
jgi:hypothetical protein